MSEPAEAQADGAEPAGQPVDVGAGPPGSLPTVWRWFVRLAVWFPLKVAGPLPLSNALTGRADLFFSFLRLLKIQDTLPARVSKFQLLKESCPATNTVSFHTQGDRRPSSRPASPQACGMLPRGSADRGEDSQGLGREPSRFLALTVPHGALCALQDKEEPFLIPPRVLLTNGIIN